MYVSLLLYALGMCPPRILRKCVSSPFSSNAPVMSGTETYVMRNAFSAAAEPAWFAQREESPAAALSTSAHTALPASSKGIRPPVPAGCTAACALPVAANRNAGKRSLFLVIILLL